MATFTPRRVLGSLLVVTALGGCATLPPPLPTVPRGESVSFDVVGSPTTGGEVPIRNLALADNLSTGTGSGVVIGALYGLTCGPLAVLCVPMGALVGGGAGIVAGAAVGVTGALSDDKAVQVRARLVRAQQAHDMVPELQHLLEEHARLQWNLQATPPAYRVSVELQGLRLTSTRDERIGFSASLLVRVQPAGAMASPGGNTKVFEYVGPQISLAEWLDEIGEVLESQLGLASRQLALQIASELTQR